MSAEPGAFSRQPSAIRSRRSAIRRRVAGDPVPMMEDLERRLFLSVSTPKPLGPLVISDDGYVMWSDPAPFTFDGYTIESTSGLFDWFCDSDPDDSDWYQPVADEFSVLRNSGPVVLDVLANDGFDASVVDEIRIVDVFALGPGWVESTADGLGVVYTAAPNYAGPDAFGYVVEDDQGRQGEAEVTVDVTTDMVGPDLVCTLASVEVVGGGGSLWVKPGDAVRVTMEVSNVSGPYDGSPFVVDVFASRDEVLDSSDMLLIDGIPVDEDLAALSNDGSATVWVEVPVTKAWPPGALYLFAGVDRGNTLAETNDGNNLSAPGGPIDVMYWFGNWPGRRQKLAVSVVDGVEVICSIRGPGSGAMMLSPDGLQELVIVGTTNKSEVKIRVKPQGAETVIASVYVEGSLKSLSAPAVSLSEFLTVEGSLGSVTMKDVYGDAIVTIGASDVATMMQFETIYDMSIDSQSPIESLKAHAWLDLFTPAEDPEASHDLILAPWIGSVIIKGPRKGDELDGMFAADLVLAGRDGGKPTLGRFKASDAIWDSIWDIAGSVGRIDAATISPDSDLTVHGHIGTIAVREFACGWYEADSIGQFEVGQSLMWAHIRLNAAIPFDQRGTSLGRLTAKEGILNSTLDSVGNVGTIKARMYGGFDLTVGWNRGALSTPVMGGDGSQTLGSTLAAVTEADFDCLAKVARIKVKRHGGILDSTFAAWQVGRVKMPGSGVIDNGLMATSRGIGTDLDMLLATEWAAGSLT